MKVFGFDNPFAYNAIVGTIGACITPTPFLTALSNSGLYTVVNSIAQSVIKPKGEAANFATRAFCLIASSSLTCLALGVRVPGLAVATTGLVVTHVIGRLLAHALETQVDRFNGARVKQQVGIL